MFFTNMVDEIVLRIYNRETESCDQIVLRIYNRETKTGLGEGRQTSLTTWMIQYFPIKSG